MRMTLANIFVAVGIQVTVISGVSAGPPDYTPVPAVARSVQLDCPFGYCTRRVCNHYGCEYVCVPCLDPWLQIDRMSTLLPALADAHEKIVAPIAIG